MKLIIDVPDDFYERMIEENGMSYIDAEVVVNAFYNATPLDKIRERISLEKLGYPPSAGYYKAIMKVLQIIDKHKTESEDKE